MKHRHQTNTPSAVAADTGWRADLVIAGITVALLASGLVSTATGHLIDRRGGRKTVVGSVGTWNDVQSAYEYWAERLATRLKDEGVKSTFAR